MFECVANDCVLVRAEVGKMISAPYYAFFGRMLLPKGSSSTGGGPVITCYSSEINIGMESKHLETLQQFDKVIL